MTRTQRDEFPPDVKLSAWDRRKGHCEKCTAKLFPGKYHYDHIKPCGLGGKGTLDNCQVICTNCHGIKTTKDRKPMNKADMQRERHAGIRKTSTLTNRAYVNGREVYGSFQGPRYVDTGELVNP